MNFLHVQNIQYLITLIYKTLIILCWYDSVHYLNINKKVQIKMNLSFLNSTVVLIYVPVEFEISFIIEFVSVLGVIGSYTHEKKKKSSTCDIWEIHMLHTVFDGDSVAYGL